MGVFAGTERQCTEDEHEDEHEHDSSTSEFRFNVRNLRISFSDFGFKRRFSREQSVALC